MERQTVYTEIMRIIVERSWIHQYDLQLCNELALRSDIDPALRQRTARSAPYQKIMLPATTEQWVRPSSAFAFPADVASSGFNQLFDTHISLINRSYSAQTQTANVNDAHNHLLAISYSIIDFASRHFFDTAVAVIEKGEAYKEDRRVARDIFAGEWQGKAMPSVWWWVNSEDKARTKLGHKPRGGGSDHVIRRMRTGRDVRKKLNLDSSNMSTPSI